MTLVLDADGLNTQTQIEISEEEAALLRAAFGVNLRLDAKSIMGQINNILSELRALDQQALLALYRSIDPAGAIGRALDARLTLTGSQRLGATFSSVSGLLTFSAAGTMNNGDLIKNDGTQDTWELIDGPHVSAGPWPEVIPATFQASETGPKLALANTVWVAVTVIANLDGFTNPTDDAEPGRDRESDADAKRRRITELYSQGLGPLATIQGVVSKVDGVTSVRVYQNTSLITDADGIPGKAFNVVAETQPTVPTAALQQLIWNAIFSATGAGGQAYGTDYAGTVTDSEGVAQAVAFDVVTLDDIELEIDLVTSTTENAITPNLAVIVKAQILATAQAEYEKVGRDVLALDFQGIVQAMITAGTITGVDAVNVRMSIQPAPVAAVAKLAITIRNKADFDSANVTVIEV